MLDHAGGGRNKEQAFTKLCILQAGGVWLVAICGIPLGAPSALRARPYFLTLQLGANEQGKKSVLRQGMRDMRDGIRIETGSRIPHSASCLLRHPM
jgi:hypothetical protein